MNKSLASALCLIAICAAAFAPVAATAADEPVVSPTTTTVPADATGEILAADTTDTEGLTLSQEQIDALESATTTTDDRSVFQKASDFVTDHAPFFIIGIVVLAAIIAGIFIARGRRNQVPAAPVAATGVAASGQVSDTSTPASVPSAGELRRRKRMAAQQKREEERLRRKAGHDGRSRPNPASAAPAPPASPSAASMASDPVDAEKRAAKGLPPAVPAAVAGVAAGAVGATAARPPSGAIPAPVSPSQTAPAAGILTPDQAAAQAPGETTYTRPVETAGETTGTAPGTEPPTVVETVPESSMEAPGMDAKVGNAAAAFAAGAAGGAVVAKAATGGDDEEAGAGALAAAPNPGEADAEQRLRAKVEEIKAGQGEQDLDLKRNEAEAVRREIDNIEPSPVPVAGLEGVERRLEANRLHRDEALQAAEDRLRRIEERAEQAERRAAFAERLTRLNLEETEREQRLNDVITGIDRAEQRTREAEIRAESAEKAAAAALQVQALPVPTSPPAAEPESRPAEAATPFHETEPVEPVRSDQQSGHILEPTKRPSFGEQPARTGTPISRIFSSDSKSSGLNLNSATFEELREADLSVTQATRILAYRERFGGYSSIEDLEKVPGFPSDVIESLRDRITV